MTNTNDVVVAERAIRYERLSEIILDSAPNFALSAEYRKVLESGNEDLQGVVLAAFGRYLMRLLTEEPHSVPGGFQLLEELAESGQSEILDALVNEVFEVRAESDAEITRFRSHLGPVSRELYDHSCRSIT